MGKNIRTKFYLYYIKIVATYKVIFLFFLTGFSISLKSQSNLVKPMFLNSFSNRFSQENPSSFLGEDKKENNISIILPSIKHTAFFCVMEDKVYSKLNVWIKLRAGSDEIYRKMIATP